MSDTNPVWRQTLPALWIDASGTELSVAWLVGAPAGVRCAANAVRSGHAGTVLFQAVSEVLAEAGASLGECRGWLHACGPGSALGLRTVAMALRTWRALPTAKETPCWAAFSTEVLAASLPATQTETPFQIAVPQGRLAWAIQAFHAGGKPADAEPRRIPAEDIDRVVGPVFFPGDAKCWSPPPAHFAAVRPSAVAARDALISGRIRFRAAEGPQLWPAEPPSFRKWEPPSA